MLPQRQRMAETMRRTAPGGPLTFGVLPIGVRLRVDEAATLGPDQDNRAAVPDRAEVPDATGIPKGAEEGPEESSETRSTPKADTESL